MTILNYLLTDEAVYLLTDTLLPTPTISPPSHSPPRSTLPHLHALVCGTDHAQAIAEWVATVNLVLVVRDVVHLDQFARRPTPAASGDCLRSRLIPAPLRPCETPPMRKPHDLAAIVNCVSEQDLAGLRCDDLLVLLEGLQDQVHKPDVIAARRKLATVILRSLDRKGELAARSRCLH